jgi:ribonucleoside-triphosphate reductase
MDTTEGVHKPLGKHVFNNINFSVYSPIIPVLRDAGYRVFPNPYDATLVLATFPVSYEDVEFDIVDGKEVNVESAVAQLERYRLLMDNYVDHNCSITVSYDKEEIRDIIEWLLLNWDSYVGVSFIYRNDPTKTAADLGYPYLPQEVVSKEVFNIYVAGLKPVNLDASVVDDMEDADCATGACPIR